MSKLLNTMHPSLLVLLSAFAFIGCGIPSNTSRSGPEVTQSPNPTTDSESMKRTAVQYLKTASKALLPIPGLYTTEFDPSGPFPPTGSGQGGVSSLVSRGQLTPGNTRPPEAMYSLMQAITKRYAEDGYVFLSDVSDIARAEGSFKDTGPKGWASTYFYLRDSRIDRLHLPFEPFMFYSGEAEAVNISLVFSNNQTIQIWQSLISRTTLKCESRVYWFNIAQVQTEKLDQDLNQWSARIEEKDAWAQPPSR